MVYLQTVLCMHVVVLAAWSALQRADGCVFFWRLDSGSATSVRSSTSRLLVSAFAMLAAFSFLPAGFLVPCLSGVLFSPTIIRLARCNSWQLLNWSLIFLFAPGTTQLQIQFHCTMRKRKEFFCSLTCENEYRKITNITNLIMLFALLLVELAKKYFSFKKAHRDVPFDELIY